MYFFLGAPICLGPPHKCPPNTRSPTALGVTIAGPPVSAEANGTLASELESVSMTTDGVVVTAVTTREARVLLRGST